MKSSNQASFGFCRPADAATANDGAADLNQRLSGRNSVAALVRSLPAEFADSMLALFLGHEFNILALDRLGHGHAAQCGVQPARLANRGAKLGAMGILLVHHAPERATRPTPGEFRITREIRQAAEDFGVHLLDHLIITRERLMDVNP